MGLYECLIEWTLLVRVNIFRRLVKEEYLVIFSGFIFSSFFIKPFVVGTN